MNFSSSDFNQPTRIEPLGFGSIVTPNTMKKMCQIIAESIHDYRVRVWAEKLVGYSSDDLSIAESIYYFIVNHCRYVKDPVGLEMLKFPMVSLQQIEVGGSPALDCDDATILIGSLLMSVGIRYALRAVSFNEEYSHVYGLAYLDKKWTPIDFVLGKKGGEFGLEPPGITRIKDMEVV
jgi:hypothetical protein